MAEPFLLPVAVRRYWRTGMRYLCKARTGSVAVVRRAQQRRLLWQANAVRRRQAAVHNELPVSSGKLPEPFEKGT